MTGAVPGDGVVFGARQMLSGALEFLADAGPGREGAVAEAAELTRSALALLESALPKPPPKNGCTAHPNAPVDPDPPQGWGRCLTCNTNRKRGELATSGGGQRPRLGARRPTDGRPG